MARSFKKEVKPSLEMKGILLMKELYQQFASFFVARASKEIDRPHDSKLEDIVKTWFLQVTLLWFHDRFLSTKDDSWKASFFSRQNYPKDIHHKILEYLREFKGESTIEHGYRTLRDELLQSLVLISQKEMTFLTGIDLRDELYVTLLARLDSLALRDVTKFNEFMGNLLQHLNSWQERKKSGIFYTPRPIIDYMVEETLKNYFIHELGKHGIQVTASSLFDVVEQVEVQELDKLFSVLNSLTILDPSMGAGDFLISVQQHLTSMYLQVLNRVLHESSTKSIKFLIKLDSREFDLLETHATNPKLTSLIIKSHLLFNNVLCGVDSDSLSVKIARIRLLLDAVGHEINEPCLETLGVSKRLLGSLKKGNSLVGLVKKSQSSEELPSFDMIKDGFHWYQEFPEIFEKHGGFSIIIGNPPYVKNKYVPQKQVLEKLYPIYVGDCDVYTLFYYRGYFLLKPGGFLTFITKNKWHHGSSYEPFITKFLQEFQPLYKVVDFSDHSLFKGVGVTCNIMFLQRKPASCLEWLQLVDSRHVFPMENSKGYQRYVFRNLEELMHGDELVKIIRKNSTSLAKLKEMGIVDYGKGPSSVPNACFTFELREIGGKHYLVNNHLTIEWRSEWRKFFFPLITSGHVNSPERHVNDPAKFLLYLDEYDSEEEIAGEDAQFYQEIKKLKPCIERRKSPKPWFKYDTARNPHLLKAPEKILSAKMKSNTFRYYPKAVAFTSGVSAIVLLRPSSQLNSLIELLPFLNSLVQRHYIMHPSSGIKHDKHRFGFDTSDNIGKLLIPRELPHEEVIYLGRVHHLAFNLRLMLEASNSVKVPAKKKRRLLQFLDLILFLVEVCTWELYTQEDNHTTASGNEKWFLVRLITTRLGTNDVLNELNRLFGKLQGGEIQESVSFSILNNVNFLDEIQEVVMRLIRDHPLLSKMVNTFLARGWIPSNASKVLGVQ